MGHTKNMFLKNISTNLQYNHGHVPECEKGVQF